MNSYDKTHYYIITESVKREVESIVCFKMQIYFSVKSYLEVQLEKR